MNTWPSLWLCADLDAGLARDDLLARVRDVVAAREAVVWLRSGLSTPARVTFAMATELAGRSDAPLFVGDRVDVALAVHAAGVHVGSRSLSPRSVRALLAMSGSAMCVSVATHDAYSVRAAAPFADALMLSPFGAVPGKAPPLGIAGFTHAIGAAPAARFVALGGIANAADAASAARAGATGFAVRRALLAERDPVRACIALDDAFRANRAARGHGT